MACKMILRVWIKEAFNRADLRLVFPYLKFAGEYPVYARQIYSTWEYPVTDQCLFLLEDSGGFPLDQLGGCAKFFEAAGVLDERRLKLFSRYQYPGIRAMMMEAMYLRLSGRSWAAAVGKKYPRNPDSLTDEDKREERKESRKNSFYAKVHAAVLSSLGERLALCSKLGFRNVLNYLMETLNDFWSGELTGYKRELFSPVASAFLRDRFFQEMEFSGDAEIDCQLFLTYFRG